MVPEATDGDDSNDGMAEQQQYFTELQYPTHGYDSHTHKLADDQVAFV